jgi:hypothetical protein
MSEPLQNGLKESILKLVAANDIDAVPDDLPDASRFFATSVRAAANPGRPPHLCLFVHSDNARVDAGQGAVRVAHLADGHDDLTSKIVFAGRDVNNGWAIPLPANSFSAAFDTLSSLGFSARATVVWDGPVRKATFYPNGTDDDPAISLSVPLSSTDVSQDEVCGVLNELYNEGMNTPSAHTVKVWVSGKVNQKLEDEIERYLKATIQAHFSGKSMRIKLLAQTTTSAGRTDLIILQRSIAGGGPVMAGVIELKILRGSLDGSVTLEGLQQGHGYRADLGLPFATLALYDVGKKKTHQTVELLKGVESKLTDAVRVRRFPLYETPAAWRKAGAYVAP